jgi:hypothetical protein
MDRSKSSTRKVNAIAIDVSNIQVKVPDKLLVDTNVWLLSSYSPFSLGKRQDAASIYADFLDRCIAEGCQLLRTPFTLPELTHVIEREEASAARERGNNKNVKQMRWEPNHRRKVIAEVLSAWQQVAEMSTWTSGIMVDARAADQMLIDFRNLKIDGYDLLIVQEALANGSIPILTDDFDFLSVPKLTVYTANHTAITAAENAGRLRA